MKKSLVACAAGLLLVSGTASAIGVSAEAGRHYTNLGVGLGSKFLIRRRRNNNGGRQAPVVISCLAPRRQQPAGNA